MDPAEVRRKNLLPPFTEPHQTAFGAVYDSGDYEAALDKVLAAADYAGLREEQAKRRAAGDTVAARRGRVLLRGDHRRRLGGRRPERERHGGGAPGRHRHHLDRDLPARPGPRDRRGPCWPARSWASRSTRSP